MTPARNSAQRVVLSAALVFALTVPVLAPATALAAVDDDIPGVAIPASPISDTLDEFSDKDDVFAVDLAAGESLTATLTGDPGTEFDLQLFAPGAANVMDPAGPLAEVTGTANPKVLIYTALAGGTHYLDVQQFTGSGAYTLEWSVAPGTPVVPSDDNIAGAQPIAPAPLTGTLDAVTDPDDVFKIALQPGEQLELSLDWVGDPADVEFSTYLFAPDATDVTTDTPLVESLPGVKPATLRFAEVEQAGDYYLDLYAPIGAGEYTLTYSVTAAASPDGNGDIPSATAVPASPAQGALSAGTDEHDVYKIDMVQGQTLTVDLTGNGVPTPEFFADLYAPGTGSISATLPVATTDPGTGFEYTATETGAYFLDVMTVDSSGDYSLTWSLSKLQPQVVASLPVRVGWGKSASLAATVTGAVGPLAGVGLEIWSMPAGGAAVKIAEVTTDGDGRVSYSVYPKMQTAYWLVVAETDTYLARTSATLKSIPYAYLTAPKTSRTTYGVNGLIATYGYLKPRHAAGAHNVKVYAQRHERQSNGTYKWVTRRIATATNYNYSSYTKWTASLRLPYKGKWRLYARTWGGTDHTTTSSSYRYLTVK